MTIENPYKSLLILLSLSFIVACNGVSNEVTLDAPETLVGKDAVIYGNDDRQEVYQHDGDIFGQIARNATAVLVQSNSVYSSGGSVTLYGASLGQTMGLCSDERFYSQPTPGFCSGTLIGPDLILTAGHCISNSSCGSTRFAFDFYYTAPNQLQSISTSDVYSCSQVLVRKEGNFSGLTLDHAIVKLDRPVTGRTPATVQTNATALSNGQGVVVMGFPSGIPAKIEDGGVVRSRRASSLDYFTADTDTFGGNSGSGVFDDNGLLVGILVRGATDYVYDSGSGCYRVNRISSGTSASEDSSYAFRAVSELCSAGYVGALCGNDDTGETGGGTVDSGGSEGGIPSSWACNTAYYDANDGCDCGCGAVDPDCSLSGQTLYGCQEGQVCSEAGSCEAPAAEEPSQGDGWTCNPNYYNANDGCDCDCGIPDPDCDRPNQQLYNCAAGETCNDAGLCEASWTCNPSYYDANDGCDCGCGIPDPDCDKPRQRLYGCSRGQSCNDAGVCE